MLYSKKTVPRLCSWLIRFNYCSGSELSRVPFPTRAFQESLWVCFSGTVVYPTAFTSPLRVPGDSVDFATEKAVSTCDYATIFNNNSLSTWNVPWKHAPQKNSFRCGIITYLIAFPHSNLNSRKSAERPSEGMRCKLQSPQAVMDLQATSTHCWNTGT